MNNSESLSTLLVNSSNACPPAKNASPWTKDEVDRMTSVTGKLLYMRVCDRTRFPAATDSEVFGKIASAIEVTKRSPGIVGYLEEAAAAGDLNLDTLDGKIRSDTSHG
jgi:hypothetical protein